MSVIEEIKEFFDKYNIEISLVYESKESEEAMLEMTFEDEYGQTVYLDHFWEGRIKAYNLIPKGEKNER